MTETLPIYEIIPKLKSMLEETGNLVLQAPPGAGKTTVVPLELLSEKWLEGKKIIMLEPRRLAARAAARRMAQILGEDVGETVGYRVRMDTRTGKKTRIEVVTEGVLIRKIQSDPELSDVGLIIFDEFHERSIEADLGLALSLDIQDALRDDLKILVMSATLDGEKIALLMNDAPILTSEGRSFDVEHHYINVKPTSRIEDDVTAAVMRALDEEGGSILVFLPGAREIERTKELLEQRSLSEDVMICPLYGMMPFAAQDQAIKKAPDGKRKIVLSTAIAETSLTIEGIRVVIDSGLQRYTAFDPNSGMTKLQTSKISRASADQRAGRAGRLEEGVCYRLWSEASNRALKDHMDPEVFRVDLTPLALDLAAWGVSDPAILKWLDVPPEATMKKSQELLLFLGAVDGNGRITDHGKAMAKFPMHPRFAHMILKAKEKDVAMTALCVAAILEERDILNLPPEQKSVDLRSRLEALLHVRNGEIKEAKKMGCHIARAKTILKQVGIWAKNYGVTNKDISLNIVGLCLAYAYPDQIAANRSGQSGAFILSSGRGAKIPDDDPIVSEKFIAVGSLDKGGSNARVYLAAPLELVDIEDNFSDLIEEGETVEWDQRGKSVKAEKRTQLLKMPIAIQRFENADPDVTKDILIEGIRLNGLDVLPWRDKAISFRKRVMLIGDGLPDLSDEALLESLQEWLGPYIENIKNFDALQKLDLYSILKNILSWDQQQYVESSAPTHIKVPSGSNIAIDYECDPPVLRVKLQEMFGAEKTPLILGGKMSLAVHLLSPAGRPLQITEDLEGFWKSSYHDVKKEMRGRYPKHPWPDDPLSASPTRKTKSRGQ